MKQLYMIANRFEPNSAATNHLLAYAQGMAECGVMITIIYLHKTKYGDKCAKEIYNVTFRYLWEENGIKNKYASFLISILKCRRLLRNDIPVCVCGLPLSFHLLLKKHIVYYHERTENPYFSNDFDGFIGRIHKRNYAKALRRCNGLFVITPSLRDYYSEEFCLDRNKVHVANMVVDGNRFKELPEEQPQNWITYCGMISEWKDGISDLLNSFASVNKNKPEYKLVIAGAFQNKSVEDKVNILLDKLSIRDSVDFKGVVKSDDMPLLLKSSKILVLPRPRQKQKAFGFATKIGEYLMTGRPIVMTNVGDVEYYLKDGESVVLAEPNNPLSFAEKLNWIIDNYDDAVEIGLKGRKVAEVSFNYKIEAEKLVKVIFGN